ncbi:MAG: hypothetical protein WCE32_05000, partial [Pseudolabrys sp.]
MAAVALTRHSLANGISDAKSERTTDQNRNHNIRHDQSVGLGRDTEAAAPMLCRVPPFSVLTKTQDLKFPSRSWGDSTLRRG